MKTLKPIDFLGSSLDDLRAFPGSVREKLGFELFLLQGGGEPSDWKPMQGIGAGVREIRIRDATGAFRTIYVTKFEEAIYVLHCFQKKSQATDKRDIELARQRLHELQRRRKK